jgi:predicted enzyme related to lactoylglutathione lyase
MSDPGFIILYVANLAASIPFYAELLGRQPLEASKTFAMFALESGVMLGLWLRAAVSPQATVPSGSGELAFTAADAPAVDALHGQWTKRGLPVLQPPTTLDFGYTFVALDPDGHRLRVFAPGAA